MKRQRQDWLPYFRALADKLRLRDWDFEILDESPGKDALASIYCVTGRKYGTIRLSETFLKDDESQQRYIATHELAHCHIALADAIAVQEIDEDHVQSYNLASEYSVDAISMAIAPFMPTPSEFFGS
jgi:hypothetical protein